MATPLQVKMLVKIALDECTEVNGAIPKNADETTTYSIGIIETPEDKGVFTSLLNSKLIWFQKERYENDSLVGLTELGFNVYQETQGI